MPKSRKWLRPNRGQRRIGQLKADLQTQILACNSAGLSNVRATGDSESTDHEFSSETGLAFSSSAIVLLLITLSARVSTFGGNPLFRVLQIDHELENCWLPHRYVRRHAPLEHLSLDLGC
jgi:hypothetical protein